MDNNTLLRDYSRYGYLYLIHEKFQSLNVFKSFKTEVELQLGKKIKAVKSNRGGEYYGRECEIVPQYTMLGKPNMNGGKTLKNACQLKQLTKSFMNFRLTKSQASNTCTFGPYRSHERNLDSRTVSCYFDDYVECSRGYKFYDPTLRSLFETGNAQFYEFEKEKNIRNVDFDAVNEIGQVLMLITIQETTLVIEDNVQTNVSDIVPKQDYDEVLPQTPIEHPQEVSLRRSIRERRHTILDDYIVFIQEHEDELV
ncbi:hypothetical protein CR513_07577, partial [Mucuna pruriens]